MAKCIVSHDALIKGMLYALLFFILILFLRMLLIFVPPIVVYVSPKVIDIGQTITLWGFMGFKDVRDASTLILNNRAIEDASIQRWSFFSIRFKITEKHRKQLKKNAHGILYVKYKDYRSSRFLISLSYDNAIGKRIPASSIPSLKMLKQETIYPQNTLVFFVNSLQSNTNPIFIEEYWFVVKTKSATHTVYPYQWNTFSQKALEFTVPISLFPTLPQENVSAEIQVMYKNTTVNTYSVLLTTQPIITSAVYEFKTEFAYDDTSRYFTAIIPLSRLWQRVSFFDKGTSNKKHGNDEQLRVGIAQGVMKNFNSGKLSFFIKRYPFHSFDWKYLSASEERTAFSVFSSNTEQELSTSPLFVPQYLRERDGYFATALHDIIYNSAVDLEDSILLGEDILSLDELIVQSSYKAERILSDATNEKASLILKMADGVIREFMNRIQRIEISYNTKVLAITAELLRNYGIPAQVVIGFAYEEKTSRKLHIKPAVWLEVFNSRYGIIPLRVTKNASTFLIMRIDYNFISYAILEHMVYLEHRNQNPQLLTKVQSFILRD